MTSETETKLIKLLEDLKVNVDETNKTLSGFIETTNEVLTEIQITQKETQRKKKQKVQNESKFLKKFKVVMGYVFQILLVLGIPWFGYMIGQKWFPDNQILQSLTSILGIIFMLIVVSQIPQSPDQKFEDENIFFYGLIKPVSEFVMQWKEIINLGMLILIFLGIIKK